MKLSGFFILIIATSFFAGFLLVSCGEKDVCGDGICGETENRENCPEDCAECGDGFCDPGETIENCPEDCFDPCTLETLKLGEACQRSSDCGPGGRCWQSDPESGYTCHQICSPGACPEGNLCADNEICQGYLDNDGSVMVFEENGEPFGLCLYVPPGEQGAYEPCGNSHGNCDEGLLCGGISENFGSFCMPSCGGGITCPQADNGMAGLCAIISGDSEVPNRCALINCDSDNNPCPDGMTCEPIDSSTICQWPK